MAAPVPLQDPSSAHSLSFPPCTAGLGACLWRQSSGGGPGAGGPVSSALPGEPVSGREAPSRDCRPFQAPQTCLAESSCPSTSLEPGPRQNPAGLLPATAPAFTAAGVLTTSLQCHSTRRGSGLCPWAGDLTPPEPCAPSKGNDNTCLIADHKDKRALACLAQWIKR